MSINKRMKKSLILTLGLVVGGLYTSTHDIYAAEREVVRTERLNVRKGPSIEESKIDFLKKGTEVEILEVEDNWYKVKSEDKKTGWVSEEYILTETQAKELEKEALAAKKVSNQNNNKVVSNNTIVSSNTENDKVVSNNTENNNEIVSNDSQNNNTEEDKTTSSNNNSGRSMTVNASAYSGHSITATGTTPKWGTIAVDPTVIPYGTKVYIPKFDKVFIAEDCGGAIKGNKIDIFMNSESECNSFGRQNIEIQILG